MKLKQKLLEQKISQINNMLSEIKSNFHTDDGTTLKYCINGTWLVKGFKNVKECFQYVYILRHKNTDKPMEGKY